MPESHSLAWGHPDRHYSGSNLNAARKAERPDDRAVRRWTEALEHASPGIQDAVERTCKQWNTILRDYLRTETALRLTVGSDSQSVPLRIVDGMPRPFADAVRELDDFGWLLLNRPAVAAVASGALLMERRVETARAVWGPAAGPSDAAEIRRVRETASAWLAKLDEMRALDQIIGINEDVLGAYFYRVPEIQLYWVVIGITACVLGVSPEALTIVVLAHELAHAYTHLGRDIDNEQWDTEWFASTDLEIVEGLAQFYTQVLCTRLEPRMPAALTAYRALLEKQSGPYKVHRDWVGDDERGGEIVRVSMIECRSMGIAAASDFSTALAKYRAGLRGRRSR